MGNVLQVLRRDVHRLFKAPAALVVVAVLIILPSLYTWFNVIGFWNPYENTGNIRVCVVNQDAGTNNEITGELNVGDQIVEQLQENTQLGWAFTDYDTAMDEVDSGKAYAAFVIPEDFSEDFTTLLTGDFQQPQLDYYVNEKAGAVSPKVTDTGATTLEETINSTFVSTVSGIVADILEDQISASQEKIGATRDNATLQLQEARASISNGRTSIANLQETTNAAIDRAGTTKTTLTQAKGNLVLLNTQMQHLSSLTSDAQGKMGPFVAQLSGALDQGGQDISQASNKANTAVGSATGAVLASQGEVDAAIANGQAAVAQNEAIIAQLNTLANTMPDGTDKTAVQAAITTLETQNASLKATLEAAQKVSDDTAAAATSISGASDSMNTAVQGSIAAANSYRNMLNSTTLPAIDNGLTQIGGATGTLSGAITVQSLLIDQASLALDQLVDTLNTTSTALTQTDTLLASLDSSLGTVQTDLTALGTSSALSNLFGEDGIDPSKIASFMLSPTQLETKTLYQLNAYGSSMAPLFTNLTLWIGVFMLMVILKQEVDDEGIKNLTIGQSYLARWLFLAPIAALQAIVCCVGNLIIGVQSVNIFLYYFTAVVASLTYLSIQYALSVTLQHIGKGICVILVFIQIPAATGLYPVEMTTPFFQSIYPLFPFTYGINAMRETIAGFYDGQWGFMMLILLLFLGISFLLGLLIRPHLTNLNRLFAKEIKESDILNGEDVQAPTHRFRLGQLVKAFADGEEYRKRLQEHEQRFIARYPRLIRGAWIFGFGVPTVATIIFTILGVEKVVVLTVWLILLIIVMCFLVIVEHMKDSFERQVTLETMSDDELRSLFSSRSSLDGSPVSHMDTGRWSKTPRGGDDQ